ncbi:hypothetical protein CTAYLR_000569 [Chrysophaeum taylorii]|uniref:Uncharacterized protein n=1 Tax=Chrysophaeum taylorii TaxID=2483200 RepID=A0AAD7UJB0_9STRA|nr:hypothetical protein CTAYLR_000569 [Chrysophaeum taylorii]
MSVLFARMGSMAEVVVSKLFPAGAGWQASSILADQLGHAADTATFAAITGVGEGLTVFAGHTTYNLVKKIVKPEVSLASEVGVATWLGSAATCSGASWQPIVNVLQASGMPFEVVFAGTWLGCGTVFLAGLRVGRVLMPWMPSPDNGNFSSDAFLSMAIGGATAFFVGTDVAYLNGTGNFLRPIVGVENLDSDLIACIKAGSSTALGFTVAQTAQNLTFPANTAWCD